MKQSKGSAFGSSGLVLSVIGSVAASIIFLLLLSVLKWVWNKIQIRKIQNTPISKMSNLRKSQVEKMETIANYAQRQHVSVDSSQFIAAQAAHETGGFKSELMKNFNNLFGMKYPRLRHTTAIGKTGNGYASYRRDSDSVDDLILWLQYNNVPYNDFTNLNQYVNALKQKNYFEDSTTNYYSGCFYWIVLLQSPKLEE